MVYKANGKRILKDDRDFRLFTFRLLQQFAYPDKIATIFGALFYPLVVFEHLFSPRLSAV
jgi:hypothetical protein